MTQRHGSNHFKKSTSGNVQHNLKSAPFINLKCINSFFVVHRIPFDQHTIFEYYLHRVGDVGVCCVHNVITLSIFAFFLNGSLLIQAGCRHIQAIFDEIDELTPTQQQPKQNSKKIYASVKYLVVTHMKIIRCYFMMIYYKSIVQYMEMTAWNDPMFFFSQSD